MEREGEGLLWVPLVDVAVICVSRETPRQRGPQTLLKHNVELCVCLVLLVCWAHSASGKKNPGQGVGAVFSLLPTH